MALISPPVCDFGWPAPDFDLPATDGQRYGFADIAGPKGTLVMFICNHCPYVLRVLDRLVSEAEALSAAGIGVVAISSNDAEAYPADSFANMGRLAAENGFPFAYLYDETQTVGRAYGAACTPDFFGFDAGAGLQYRGRLDAGPGTRRDLYEAMIQVAQTGQGPGDQVPSMGCSIKWKSA